ncbi:MAG: heme o synthase [Gammaproteobacteria bacterium]|nr:heme o synthase [Gammaproteobacteria bacterium]
METIMISCLRQYLILCKARVVLLMLLTTWAGMYLSTHESISLWLWINTTLGIAFMSGSAATINHIINQHIDAIMERTKRRPLPTGNLSLYSASVFATLLGSSGFLILFFGVNILTAILTLLAAIGYSIVYSAYLKHATSQNIVIGGLSGAMPPLLGWVAVTGQIDPQAWLLVLIIFSWTPAHVWALSLHRLEDYKRAGVPMLPITHGVSFTKLNIIFYSLLTIACSLLPYAIGMSGKPYFVCALLLGMGLLGYALKLQLSRTYHRIALKTFHYSLIYLTGLFFAILLDHHLLLN